MAKSEATYYPQPRKGSGYRFKNPRTGKTIECAGVEWYLDYRDEAGKRKRHKAHTELCRCPQRKMSCEHERMAQQLAGQFVDIGIGIDCLNQVTALKQEIPPALLADKLEEFKVYVKHSQNHSHSYWKSLRNTFQHFQEWCDGNTITQVSQVTEAHAQRYSLFLQTENIAAAEKPTRYRRQNTINKFLRELRTVFYVFEAEKLIHENPFREKKGSTSSKIFMRVTDQKPITVFTDAELKLLLSLTRQDFAKAVKSYADVIYDMIPLFYHSGMRLGEVCNLTYAQVRGNKIYIEPHHDWKPKWGIRRSIPLHHTVQSIIERRKAADPGNEYVFTTSSGTPFDEKNIYHRMRTLFDAYGIVGDTQLGVSPHCFRRTFCTQTLASNVPVTVVQEWMGHSKVEMTMKYYSKIASKTDHFIHAVDFVSKSDEFVQ